MAALEVVEVGKTWPDGTRALSGVSFAVAAGETLGPDDLYFVTSPTFETASEKYGWLNDIVAIGKIVSCKTGDGEHVTYDIFAVR